MQSYRKNDDIVHGSDLGRDKLTTGAFVRSGAFYSSIGAQFNPLRRIWSSVRGRA